MSASLAPVTPPRCHRASIEEREQTIAKLEAARGLLQEIRSIQDAKQIHDVAKAARVYAREQKLGREVVTLARAVTYEALRRIGELLKETERNRGTRGQLVGPGVIGPSRLEGPIEPPPTLAELGLDYKTSSIAQQLSALPPADFLDVRDGHKTLDQVMSEKRRAADIHAQIELIDQRSGSDAADLFVCSCADLFAAGIRPDAVITQPPCGPEHLHVLSELAVACADVPLVAVRLEKDFRYLAEVMDRLRVHLNYRNAQIGGHGLTLLFCQDDDAFERAAARGRAVPGPTSLCPYLSWDQYFVQSLCGPGELVCDPFLRPWTAIAALEFGRRIVGCSPDADVVADTRRRIEARG